MTRDQPSEATGAPPHRTELTWDDLKTILAIAREGSLTRAARSLGLAQSTVGRRLATLEAQLGEQLFERGRNGLPPTAIGEDMIPHLRRMEEAAAAINLGLLGRDRSPSGVVIIATTAWFGSHILTPLMGRFLDAHPGITLTLRAGPHEHSLAKREADLALRAHRFEQDKLVQRKVGEIGFGLFASRDYLAAAGRPDFPGGGAGHRLVMLDREHGPSEHSALLAALLPQAKIVWRTDNSESVLHAASAGIGLAMMPILQARATDLVRMATPEPLPSRAIWLGYHAELRGSPRIRATIDFLSKSVRALTRPE